MASVAFNDPATPAPEVARALRRALRSWDQLLEWLPIGVYACDRDGHLIQYNQRAAELWGHTPDVDAPRYRYSGAYKAYSVTGEKLEPADMPMAEMLTAAQPIRDRELDIERPDGTRITILTNLDPIFDEDGKLVGGVGCFHDITARKLAENRLQEREQWYRALLDALPAAIYTTDAKGRLTFFNQASVALSGRTPALGNDAWSVAGKLFRPDGSPISREDWPTAVALRTGKPVRGTEKIVERPDGTRVPVLPYPTPLYDADGRLVGAVNMLVDITERKQAEEHKTLLLRELAHRINNTFAVILAIAQQSLRASYSAEDFAGAFTGRLQALAQAHNLLLAKDWAGAELGELAKGQLAPFCLDAEGRCVIEGPKIRLGPSQVIALGVVLHELGTNAAKYGALSNNSGKVTLNWTTKDGRVLLTWTERNGPAVSPPERKGLGSKLIERGLPAATIDWRFEPEGVVCTIDLPLDVNKQTATSSL